MKNCIFCKKEFEAKTKRLCCTRSCAAKFSTEKKGGSAWKQEEIEYLENNLGVLPFPVLVKSFKKWSKKQGYPERTDTAIEVQIHRMTSNSPLSRKCTEDNFTVYELSRGLGVPLDRIRLFVRSGKLQFRKIAHNQNAVKRKDAIALVLNNPSHFANCDRDNLFWLLEDAELVEKVKSSVPSTRGFRRSVRCYAPDGIRVYSGVKEAARANFVKHNCISQAIARGGKSAGMKWEWVE
jgi:hypothetical protein